MLLKYFYDRALAQASYLSATREIVRIKTGEARLAPTKASHVIYLAVLMDKTIRHRTIWVAHSA